MSEDGHKSPDTDGSEADFKARLGKAKKAARPDEQGGLNESTAWGVASRLIAELVSGLVLGGLIGWIFDRVFDTKPFGILVFFLLGIGAGITNVMRAARQMNEAAQNTDEDDD